MGRIVPAGRTEKGCSLMLVNTRQRRPTRRVCMFSWGPYRGPRVTNTSGHHSHTGFEQRATRTSDASKKQSRSDSRGNPGTLPRDSGGMVGSRAKKAQSTGIKGGRTQFNATDASEARQMKTQAITFGIGQNRAISLEICRANDRTVRFCTTAFRSSTPQNSTRTGSVFNSA